MATVLCWLALAVTAQEFSGLARVDIAESRVDDTADGLRIELSLSQGVPYRVFTLDQPARLVLDFREVDWADVSPGMLDQSDRALNVRMGGFRPGWSRMVIDLAGPYLLRSSALEIDEISSKARLEVDLSEGSIAEFAAAAGAPPLPGWDVPETVLKADPRPRQRGDAPLIVVLDPGHGGIDPGAEQGEAIEKDLMLRFARELQEALLRAGGFEVVLTRHDDSFVSLERRVAVAHQARADVFISLHADAVSEGRARGATVYTLSESASDAASAALAERHDRSDMMAGIDLSGSDDVVADVLMDLARMETQPRAQQLAQAIRLSVEESKLPLNSRPDRAAAFSVLKSPDIPSVLLELGFLSSEKDAKNLQNPEWRARMAKAVQNALAAWRIADAAAADLVRQ